MRGNSEACTAAEERTGQQRKSARWLCVFCRTHFCFQSLMFVNEVYLKIFFVVLLQINLSDIWTISGVDLIMFKVDLQQYLAYITFKYQHILWKSNYDVYLCSFIPKLLCYNTIAFTVAIYLQFAPVQVMRSVCLYYACITYIFTQTVGFLYVKRVCPVKPNYNVNGATCFFKHQFTYLFRCSVQYKRCKSYECVCVTLLYQLVHSRSWVKYILFEGITTRILQKK